jgi:tRNA A-37 threonylcarbamoyl transferase component Bud32
MGRIGRYEIESILGKGAMGVVFLARDPQLGRQVALKTYALPEGIDDEVVREFEERLLREAHAAAALSHPNIVTVHDAGIDEDRRFPYIVMEYVPGRSLKEFLDGRHRMAPDLVLRFGEALASALDAAHRAGIVHRDIKPANILVRDSDGLVKVTDFGVARLSESDLTRTGTLVGSPAYMAPEQIRGGVVDARSDLFSLALVLYEALTSKRAFGGEDLAAVTYALVHETPAPVRHRIPDLPAGLDPFFERAFAKDPEDRFQDAGAFRSALLEAARADTIEMPVTGPIEEDEAASAAKPKARKGRGLRRLKGARSKSKETAGETVAAPSRENDAAHEGDGLARAGAAAPFPPGFEQAQGLRAVWIPLLIAFFFLLTLGAAPFVFARRPAFVLLEAHRVATESLHLTLDGREVPEPSPSHAPVLAGLGGGAAVPARAGVFERGLEVPRGRHTLEVEARLPGRAEPARVRRDLDLAAGETRTLRLVAVTAPDGTTRLRLD